jgi:poly(3-hydroxybutyrate) depolymerase
MRWLLAVLLLSAGCLAAQDAPPAQGTRQLEVRNHQGQSYWMFVPSNYTADRAWPILYCLDPGARGRVPVERFAAAAEKAGFLVAGSNNSRNGPMAPTQEAINLLVGDTHERFSIDDARVYVAGLSGGARVALEWAENGHIAGVIACSAGFGPPGPPKQISFRLFATTGWDDFNHDELYHLSRELARRNVPHRFVEFEGGHEWMPAALAGEAFGFFLGRVPAQPAPASKEAENQAAQYDRLMAQLQAGDDERRSVIKQAQKDAAREQDSPARRVARRVIGGVSVGAMEYTRELMAQKRYGDAARTAEEAVMARPENSGAWYSLAVASAAAGNTRRALEALEQAAARGWGTWERMEAEPLLAKVRRDARYAGILAKMRR